MNLPEKIQKSVVDSTIVKYYRFGNEEGAIIEYGHWYYYCIIPSPDVAGLEIIHYWYPKEYFDTWLEKIKQVYNQNTEWEISSL